MKFETNITVKKPINDVYKYLVDPKNLKDWVDDFKQYNQKKGKRSKKGSIGTLVFEDKEGVLNVKEEIINAIPIEVFEISLNHENMESTVVNKFYDLGGNATKIIVYTKVKLKPYIANLFSPLVKREMRMKQLGDYKRLKYNLEQQGQSKKRVEEEE